MEQSRQGEQFRILDPAIPAKRPAAPNRIGLILVSVLLAVGTAGAAAMLVEHLDTSFHTLDDLRSFTKVPVLASIPSIVGGVDTARQARQRLLTATSIALGLALVVAASYHLAHGNDQLVHMLSRGAS
jgi:Ca2+/H+ antiporter